MFFITKLIVFIIQIMYIYFFSEENSLICPHLEEVYLSLIASFEDAIRQHIFRMHSDLNVTLLVKIRWSQYAWI